MLLHQVSDLDVRKLLVDVAPKRKAELTELLDKLAPLWLLDRESDDAVFKASPGQPNRIIMGLKCSKRLQVQAYSTAVILSALGKSKAERDLILEPVNAMLNWSVGVELGLCYRRAGIELPADHPLKASEIGIPDDVLNKLSASDKLVGFGLFRIATAWILFHELAHLELGHVKQAGFASISQEKDADRFATEWMVEAIAAPIAGEQESERLGNLLGIAIALLWVSIFNVYFGPNQSANHPEGYDRLFQVLDQVVDHSNDRESIALWQSISTLLFVHMRSAGFDFGENDAPHLRAHPREGVNHLINRISRFERSAG